MKMKICPKCGKPISYNYYFGAYICNDCDWEQPNKVNRQRVFYL